MAWFYPWNLRMSVIGQYLQTHQLSDGRECWLPTGIKGQRPPLPSSNLPHTPLTAEISVCRLLGCFCARIASWTWWFWSFWIMSILLLRKSATDYLAWSVCDRWSLPSVVELWVHFNFSDLNAFDLLFAVWLAPVYFLSSRTWTSLSYWGQLFHFTTHAMQASLCYLLICKCIRIFFGTWSYWSFWTISTLTYHKPCLSKW